MNAPWLAMPDMGAIPMPGGWRMSAIWLPMCGQSWLGATAGFTGMWGAMMVPMMLPAVAAPLWRYRAALHAAGAWRAGLLVLTAGLAWTLAWTALGVPLFAIGSTLAQALLRAPALARLVPALSALICGVAAGWLWGSWPGRAARRSSGAPGAPAFTLAALYGARLGVHCIRQCAGLTVVLLCIGIMDRGAMAGAAAAVIIQRLAAAYWPRLPHRLLSP